MVWITQHACKMPEARWRFLAVLLLVGIVSHQPTAAAEEAGTVKGATVSKTAAAVLHKRIPDRQVLGVYCGNKPKDVIQFETWLGRKVDGILGYTGHANWRDYNGSVGWAVSLWGKIDRRVLWSIPLIPRGASLSEAAEGNYNKHYRRAAKILAKYRPRDPVLYIRTGWEFNGDWFPWSAHGQAEEFKRAFQNFVKVFKSVSPRFRFEWNVNVGDVGMDPTTAYPGDEYVDIIGMNFYWNTSWDPSDPVAAFNSMMYRKWGLKWHQDFAKAHGKPTAYSEWGVMSNDGAVYIELVKEWFGKHDVVYQTYWNSDADFKGMLSKGEYPDTGNAYRASFGAP
jgi:Glycosyl hydrolase family 26